MPDPTPAEVFPPSEYLRDELEARGWSINDLAKKMRTTEQYARLLASGDVRITPGMAARLAHAFPGTAAQTWLNLQAGYHRALAALDAPTPFPGR